MAVVREQNFDGGANGVTFDSTNTDYAVFSGTTGEFSDLYPRTPPLAGRFFSSGEASSTSWGRYNFDPTTVRYMRAYFTIPAAQGATISFWRLRSGTASVLNVRTNASRQFILADAGLTTLATSSVTFTDGEPFRLEWGVDGTSATLRIFVGPNVDGVAPDEALTGAIPGTPFDNVNEGFLTGRVNYEVHLDAIVHDDATWPGPAAGGVVVDPPAWVSASVDGPDVAVRWSDVDNDPVSLDVTVTGSSAELTWPAPAMAGATHVDVFRRGPTADAVDDSPFDPTVDARIARVPVAQTSYTDEGLAAGNYAWQVIPLVEGS